MIWWLLACKTSPQVAGTSGDTAMPYSVNTAELDGAQAAALAQALLDLGLPLSGPIAAEWTAVVDAFADPLCPDRVDYSMLDAPFGCEAESGAYFSGMTALKRENGSIELLCDAYVNTPDGERFECGGEALQFVGPSGQDFWTLIIGSFGWHGRPVDQGGLYSAALTIQTSPDGQISLDGGMSVGNQAVNLQGLTWRDEVRSGSVGVATGHGWYRAAMGPDGCGAWEFEDGTQVGEGCVNLTSAMEDWQAGVAQ